MKNKVELKMPEEREAVIAEVENVSAKIAQISDFQALDADKQVRITVRIESRKSGLDLVTLITVLRDRAKWRTHQLTVGRNHRTRSSRVPGICARTAARYVGLASTSTVGPHNAGESTEHYCRMMASM